MNIVTVDEITKAYGERSSLIKRPSFYRKAKKPESSELTAQANPPF